MALLLPFRYKRISRFLFYFSFLLGLIYLIFFEGNQDLEQLFTLMVPAFLSDEIFGELVVGFQWVDAMILDEILSILIVVFGLIAGFSKERNEDELIDKMRNNSLRWSLFINYGILLLSILGVYGIVYLSFMFAQLFLIIFLYNFIFDIKLLRHYKSAKNEE